MKYFLLLYGVATKLIVCAGEIVQLVKFLPCKNKDLNVILRTHIKSQAL